MSRKGIILSLVILIGLGLYVFLVEKKKPLPEGKEVILKLDKLDKDKIQRLTLGHDGKEIILDKGKDGKWQITSPLITKADDEVIKGMVDDLSNLEASQSLEVNPAEWEDFGLKKPGIEVALSIEGRGEEKLSFGDKNPAGTSTYARIKGKDKVFLISSYLANGFKKEIFDLREKRLLSFEKDKVKGLELIYSGEDIVLEKQGEDWQVIKPVKDKGDKYEIENLISNLCELKAAGFIDDVQKDETYGLDKPELRCIILVGTEKLGQTLACGKVFKEEEKDLQYARRELINTIAKVETSKVSDLKRTVFDLRNKIILSFDKEKISKIELFYPEKSLVMEKDKDNKWFLVSREKMELDSDKINDLLWELADLKVKGIIVEEIKDPSLYGLDKPEVKVMLTIEGQQKVILLGKKVQEKEDNIYASIATDPRLFLVSADLSSRLKKDPAELKKEESAQKKEVEK